MCVPPWMMPRTFPAVVSTTGPSYFDDASAPKAAAGIKPPNRALAAAAPLPCSEDFNSARRLTLRFRKSFRGLLLLFGCMEVTPLRISHIVNVYFHIRIPELGYISNFGRL